MKLILLYGAPATGKLTIATELSRQTGYTLFHNHIILNALSEIFGYDHPTRRKLEKEFRLRIVEETVKANINIIATGVIMRDNEAFYRKITKIVSDNQSECILIHLTATKEILKHRIDNESRKELKKISTVKRFEEWQQQYPESFEKIEYLNQYTVDTSISSTKEIVSNIIKHYKLA